MLLKINGTTVDVVEGANIEMESEGGIEYYYGSRAGKHSYGGRKGTFSVRRWYKDNDDGDLLYDLFELELPFSLSGEINGVANSSITLSNCVLNRYKLVMGGTGDIVAEEASGEAVAFTSTL